MADIGSPVPIGVQQIPVAINATQTVSPSIDLEGYDLIALEIPTGFTGTTVTFNVAEQFKGTYQPLFDSSGVAVSMTVAPGRCVGFTQAHAFAFRGVRFIQLVVAAQATNIIIMLLRKHGAF